MVADRRLQYDIEIDKNIAKIQADNRVFRDLF